MIEAFFLIIKGFTSNTVVMFLFFIESNIKIESHDL